MVALAHSRVAGVLWEQRKRHAKPNTGAATLSVHCPRPQNSVRFVDHRFPIAPATHRRRKKPADHGVDRQGEWVGCLERLLLELGGRVLRGVLEIGERFGDSLQHLLPGVATGVLEFVHQF